MLGEGEWATQTEVPDGSEVAWIKRAKSDSVMSFQRMRRLTRMAGVLCRPPDAIHAVTHVVVYGHI